MGQPDAVLNDGDGSADATDADFLEEQLSKFAAWDVVLRAHDYLRNAHDLEPGAFSIGLSSNTSAIAAFIRKLGRERARPDVVAQQMKILGLIPAAEISAADRLVLDLFTHTLTTIDAFAAEEAARIAAEKLAAERQAPAPLPIEDTTMEPVSDTMDTW